jgi:hypothetical protein
VSDFITIRIPNLSNFECGALATTAAEGGINYWAMADEYDWTRWCDKDTTMPNPTIPDDFVFYSIMDKEEGDFDTKHPITPETFRRGMELLFDKYPTIRCAVWFLENDRKDWDCADAEAADVLVQLGIFGDIIYG